jgi:uncharacterized protein YkwD
MDIMHLCRSVVLIAGFFGALSIACPTPDQAQTSTEPEKVSRQNLSAKRLADLEKQMWALVNRDRLNPATFAETGGRAHPLKWNEKLAAVARAHSLKMIEQQFFSHVEPDGKTPSARINAAGIPWRAYGENIAMNDTVASAQAALMFEPRFQKNHRGNILNTMYSDVGIGIAQGKDGSLYITQDFVAIPASSRVTDSGSE